MNVELAGVGVTLHLDYEEWKELCELIEKAKGYSWEKPIVEEEQ